MFYNFLLIGWYLNGVFLVLWLFSVVESWSAIKLWSKHLPKVVLSYFLFFVFLTIFPWFLVVYAIIEFRGGD